MGETTECLMPEIIPLKTMPHMTRPVHFCPLAVLGCLAFSLCAGEQSYGQTVQADQAALARSQP